MARWIDITGPAFWQPSVSTLGGDGSLTIVDEAFAPMDVTDSTSADGLYFEYISGVWTPTRTVGTPPADGSLAFLKYIGAFLDDLSDIRITTRNRAAITDLESDGLTYYGPLGMTGTTPPPGSYLIDQTFVFTFTVDGATQQYSDADTGALNTILNHIYSLVATADFDHATFALAPKVLFDILKIEVFAAPPAGFWTDFVNCEEDLP